MRYFFLAAPIVALVVLLWGAGVTTIAGVRGRLPAVWRKHLGESRRERNFIASVSFFVMFAFLRYITWSIHSGRPTIFHDVQSGGGTHIHHLVWGILGLLLVGYLWLLEIGSGRPDTSVWAGRLTSMLFGVAAALTLDEFALWFHLADVYWSREGRASIHVALLFGSLLSAGFWGRPFIRGVHRAAFTRKPH